MSRKNLLEIFNSSKNEDSVRFLFPDFIISSFIQGWHNLVFIFSLNLGFILCIINIIDVKCVAGVAE